MLYSNHLETFITVVESGSFRGAAEKIGISPSAVLKQISLLEQDLKLKDNVIPYQLLRSRFEKYNFFTMQYLLETLGNTTNKVNNPKKYLLVALYNAPITMDNYYEFEVNHDMNKWEGRD